MVIFQCVEITLPISAPSPSCCSQPVGPCSGPVIPAVWAKSYYNPLPPPLHPFPSLLVPSPPAPSFRQSVFAAVNGNRGEAEIAYKQWGKSEGTKQEKQEEAGRLFQENKKREGTAVGEKKKNKETCASEGESLLEGTLLETSNRTGLLRRNITVCAFKPCAASVCVVVRGLAVGCVFGRTGDTCQC